MKNIRYFKFISHHNKLINHLRKEIRLKRKTIYKVTLRLNKLLKDKEVELKIYNQEIIRLRNSLQIELHNTNLDIKRIKYNIKFIKSIIKEYLLG